MVSAGLYLGHRVMPLPKHLLTRIINLEFEELKELLPEAWLMDGDDYLSTKCYTGTPVGTRKRHLSVTNTFTWLQGSASLVSALSTRFPTMVPEFLAYQSKIINATVMLGAI